MCTFLNEIYHCNTVVQAGMRSFVKINNVADIPIKSLIDDIDYVYSSARGSVFAGASLFKAYFVAMYLTVDSVKKWGKKKQKFIVY